MALVLKELYKSYTYLDEIRDKRLDHYFLMGSPLKLLALILTFHYFIKRLGPQLMENRKAFELKTIMIAYNLIQVISNFILAGVGIYLASKRTNLMCMPVDFSTPNGLYEAQVSYCYFILKVTDLLDTVFFVLRKKYNQITFLHVYHHTVMVGGTFIYTTYAPGGQGLVLGIINCYVHVVMYFYYFLTCVNSNLKSSLWWKKHLTQMQLVQFTLIIIHFGYALLSGNCKYQKFLAFVIVVQNLFMFILFSDFYYKAYVKKPVKFDKIHNK